MQILKWEDMPENGWDGVPEGTEVSEEIYNNMLNLLPPINLRRSPYCGFQVSEPDSHCEDENGKWRSKHATFVNIGEKYYYAGVQFCGECRWRLEK